MDYTCVAYETKYESSECHIFSRDSDLTGDGSKEHECWIKKNENNEFFTKEVGECKKNVGKQLQKIDDDLIV